jgi:signal transduction histidine kinase
MAASGDSIQNLDLREVVDHLGAGLLIFDSKDNLLLDNPSVRRILGAHLVLIRSEGWSAFAMLIDASPGPRLDASELRNATQRDGTPMRFSIMLAGTYMPCWAASFKAQNGETLTQIVIDNPDWTALTELMSAFRSEAQSAITNTDGHANFVRQILKKPKAGSSVEDLGKRSMGMIDLISNEMHHLQLFLDMLHRLEIIRTGQLADQVAQSRTRIDFEDFFEDFLEELSEEALLDPTIDPEEYRSRLHTDVAEDILVDAPRVMLRSILRDLMRNAFIYSEPPSPVHVQVIHASQGRLVEFAISDEGCGVRQKERPRVFEPFQRARQPHVMREHGHGLSLYLAKAEVEALGGRMWYDSEEGVGSTFRFKIPAYQKQG